jgi:hypothetical protein
MQGDKLARKGKWFLEPGNGHQVANRKKALNLVVTKLDQCEQLDEQTVSFPPYGACHFHAFTSPDGAMVSSPGKDDNEFGTMEWHSRDHSMMFRDFGDGRCIVYVGPIKPLFGMRTIGYHGVTWENVLKNSVFKRVFKPEELS